MKAVFSRHGVPEIVVNDSSSRYSAADEYNIHHATSSPRFPLSNGKNGANYENLFEENLQTNTWHW